MASSHVRRTFARGPPEVVPVPESAIGFLTGSRGQKLRGVEADTGTFCFIEGAQGSERLLVFGTPSVLNHGSRVRRAQ